MTALKSIQQLPSAGRVRPLAAITGAGARSLHAFGHEMKVLLSGAQTGGRCTMLLDTVPPGVGVPPHFHEREDEWFFVLEGRAAFWIDAAWKEVPPGAAIFGPRRVAHGFKNIGDSPLRLLITLSPAGFDEWFARCAEEFATTPSPGPARLAALASEHGMYFPET